LKNKDWWQP